MIRAVIFDMDGVLINTEKYLSRYWRQAAGEFGFSMSFEESLKLRSLTVPFAVKETKKMFGENFDYLAVRQRRKELMAAWLSAHGVEKKPGVDEAFADLKQRGIKLAIATATDEVRAEAYLREIGVFDMVDRLICVTMVKIGKPMPDVYLYACEQLGEKPEDCIAVEDSPNGILAAYGAGCRAVMIPDLSEPEADIQPLLFARLDSLSCLPELLDREAVSQCCLCPRECGVDRAAGEKGYCGASAQLKAARAALHMWEEPCISGEEGSGTVFFSGCPLHCAYCQNEEISKGTKGKEITAGRLSEIFLELQQRGANNINLVTPTHYILPIRRALKRARGQGLSIPVVYNCGGYEKPETLRLLDGLVDIYLPDFKYMSTVLGKRYSQAEDYAVWARASLKEMVRQAGKPVFDEKGRMKRGVLVRHLALPGQGEDSREILAYLHRVYGSRIFISIMNQYTPIGEKKSQPELNRTLTGEEYEQLVEYAIFLGIEQGFIQEGATAEESFIPAFDGEGI